MICLEKRAAKSRAADKFIRAVIRFGKELNLKLL